MTPARESTLVAMSDEQLVKEARALLVEAEGEEREAESLAEQASKAKWGVADRIVALREHGWTQKRIGEAIGLTQSSVSVYEKAARHHAVPGSRPRFAAAYYEVKGQKDSDETQAAALGRALRDRPIEQVERIVRELPPERQAVLAEMVISPERQVDIARTVMRHPERAEEVLDDRRVERTVERVQMDRELDRIGESHGMGRESQREAARAAEQLEREQRSAPMRASLAVTGPLSRAFNQLGDAWVRLAQVEENLDDFGRERIRYWLNTLRSQLDQMMAGLEAGTLTDDEIARWLADAEREAPR
jgi:predicted transcriptional regulator